MEQAPRPSQPLESYVYNETTFFPEKQVKDQTRSQVSSWIHNMTVSNMDDWDTEMHPAVDRLEVGETTVLQSDAPEYLKVTRTSGNTFDVEYGATDS